MFGIRIYPHGEDVKKKTKNVNDILNYLPKILPTEYTVDGISVVILPTELDMEHWSQSTLLQMCVDALTGSQTEMLVNLRLAQDWLSGKILDAWMLKWRFFYA